MIFMENTDITGKELSGYRARAVKNQNANQKPMRGLLKKIIVAIAIIGSAYSVNQIVNDIKYNNAYESALIRYSAFKGDNLPNAEDEKEFRNIAATYADLSSEKNTARWFESFNPSDYLRSAPPKIK